MKRALLSSLLAAALLAALAGCGEKPQTLGSAKAHGSPLYNGTGSAFMAPGWKPGDQASWEQALRTRNQNQNDYSKVN